MIIFFEFIEVPYKKNKKVNQKPAPKLSNVKTFTKTITLKICMLQNLWKLSYVLMRIQIRSIVLMTM